MEDYVREGFSIIGSNLYMYSSSKDEIINIDETDIDELVTRIAIFGFANLGKSKQLSALELTQDMELRENSMSADRVAKLKEVIRCLLQEDRIETRTRAMEIMVEHQRRERTKGLVMGLGISLCAGVIISLVIEFLIKG